MSPYTDGDSPIDLTDLKRDAAALLTDFQRAEQTITADTADTHDCDGPTTDPRADTTLAGTTTTHTTHAEALTDAVIDGDSGDDADAPPPAGLAGQVDALIDDAVAAVESLDAQLTDGGDERAAPVSDTDADTADAIARTVDALVEETTRVAGVAPPTEPDTHPNTSADEDTNTNTSADTSDAKASSGAPVSLEALDAALESEADALASDLDDLEGEFEAPEGVHADTADAPAADAEVGWSPRPAPGASVDPPITDADSHSPAPAPSPTPTPASAAPPPPPPTPRPPGPVAPLRQRVTAIVTPARIEALRRRVLELLARPVRRLSPAHRDLIGWVGINTVFIAVCLWLFLILR